MNVFLTPMWNWPPFSVCSSLYSLCASVRALIAFIFPLGYDLLLCLIFFSVRTKKEGEKKTVPLSFFQYAPVASAMLQSLSQPGSSVSSFVGRHLPLCLCCSRTRPPAAPKHLFVSLPPECMTRPPLLGHQPRTLEGAGPVLPSWDTDLRPFH